MIPRGYADAGVIAPVPGSQLGVAIAVAGDPALGARDARLAAEYAVLEAVRRVVAVGATPIGLTDCLNFGNPTKPEQYADFVAAVDGLKAAAEGLNLPFVSGNVSLYNEGGSGEPIPASAIVACIGRMDDVSKAVTPALKRAGSVLVAVDEIERVAQMTARGEVLSCAVACTDGAVAAMIRMALHARRQGRELGVTVDDVGAASEFAAFVVECESPKIGRPLARVTAEPEFVAVSRTSIATLYEQWQRPLEGIYP